MKNVFSSIFNKWKNYRKNNSTTHSFADIFWIVFYIYIYILTLRENKGKKRIKNEPTSLNPGNIQPQGVPHHAGSFIALNCAFRD